MTAAQISGAVVACPISGLKLNCCFLIFSANWNAADRHGRRLESEHRPDPLLYSPVILLDHVSSQAEREEPEERTDGANRMLSQARGTLTSEWDPTL
jgi:hypothetical protein